MHPETSNENKTSLSETAGLPVVESSAWLAPLNPGKYTLSTIVGVDTSGTPDSHATALMRHKEGNTYEVVKLWRDKTPTREEIETACNEAEANASREGRRGEEPENQK